MKSIYIIFLCQLISLSVIQSQEMPAFSLAKVDRSQFIPELGKVNRYTTPLRYSKNDIEMVLTVFFNGYKLFFSSQDLNTCTFIPSCSVYGLQAIRKTGLIMGTMKTFDRLSRCHGFARELYEIDKTSRLQIDRP